MAKKSFLNTSLSVYRRSATSISSGNFRRPKAVKLGGILDIILDIILVESTRHLADDRLVSNVEDSTSA